MLKSICVAGLLFINTLFAQKEAFNWYFGDNAGLNFSTNPPTILNNSKVKTGEGCSSISDKEGNLLFYTDGSIVYNSLHDTMSNGMGLFGDPSSTSSAIIIPKPGTFNPSLKRYDHYYIFTSDYEHGSHGICFSEIDMNGDNGLGEVLDLSKNTHLIDSNSCEKITAVRHSNECDYWFIAKSFNTPHYYAYLINSSGINLMPVLSNGPFSQHTTGEITVSPNQNLIAAAYAHHFYIEVLDFDRSNGTMSLKFSDSTIAPYGIEFSPDNSKLYVSPVFDSNVLQYEVNVSSNIDFKNSKVVVGQSTGNHAYISGALQLAPNGKIYVTNPITNGLNVIHNPNLKGNLCNFEQNGQLLGSGSSYLSLPSIPSFYIFSMDSIEASNDLCLLKKTFNLSSYNGVYSIEWNILNASDILLHHSLDSTVTYTFKETGLYFVKAYVTKCYQVDTLLFSLNIIDQYPVADFTSSPVYSDFDEQIYAENQSNYSSQYQWFVNSNYSSNQFNLFVPNQYQHEDLEICLVAINILNGCQDTSCNALQYIQEDILYVPNSFTPNNDGINDEFIAYGKNIEDFALLVFDKWGELIFETTYIEKGWNGLYKGVAAKTDLYVWKINYKVKNSISRKEAFGHLNLLR